jgi:hypothetical protein
MSGEREVSLRSGDNVYRALQAEGIPAVKIDVGRDVAEVLVASKATAAYIALHGGMERMVPFRDCWNCWICPIRAGCAGFGALYGQGGHQADSGPGRAAHAGVGCVGRDTLFDPDAAIRTLGLP